MTHLSRRAWFARLAQPDRPEQVYTAAAAFFRQYTRPQPRLDVRFWGLSLGGAVAQPLVWSRDDLDRMPQTTLDCTLVCASNPPGGERIGHGRWRGVALEHLLAHATLSPDAAWARLEGADGHVTSLPLARLRTGMVAFSLNDAPLSASQGFPARLIVSGVYDYKLPRWLTRIEMGAAPTGGAWEQRGYSADGTADVTAGITDWRVMGDTARLWGYAYTGDAALGGVALSRDDDEWTPLDAAQISHGAPGCWSRWTALVALRPPSALAVSVRAWAASGASEPSAQHTAVIRP